MYTDNQIINMSVDEMMKTIRRLQKPSDKTIDDIIELVTDSLSYMGYCMHSMNCEVVAYVDDNDKEKLRGEIRKIIGGEENNKLVERNKKGGDAF